MSLLMEIISIFDENYPRDFRRLNIKRHLVIPQQIILTISILIPIYLKGTSNKLN